MTDDALRAASNRASTGTYAVIREPGPDRDGTGEATANVSVVVVNWNAPHLLARCLNRLRELTMVRPFEVIVVDNGSTEEGVRQICARGEGVRLVELPRNHGYGVAANVGISLAASDFVLILNPDALPGDRMVTRMARALADDDALGCVGARHRNPDLTLQDSTGHFPTLLSEIVYYSDIHRVPFLKKWVGRRLPNWRALTVTRDVDWVNGACMMVRRKAFWEVGGFDDHFFLFAEEVDLCFRMKQLGWGTRFLHDAEVIHTMGGSFTSGDRQRLIMIYQSSLRFFLRHRRGSYLALRIFVFANALARSVVAFGLLLLFAPMSRDLPSRLHTVLTHGQVDVSPASCLRMWLAILVIRPYTPIRPTPPPSRGDTRSEGCG